jgi:hypothetical protein
MRTIIAVVALMAATASSTSTAPRQPAELAALWEDPGDIAARDLRWGPGGKELAPSADAEFTFKALDATGYSGGYDVVDPQGRKWDVKTGDEGQPEVVVSRVLWAVGYHQPVMYFVPEWKLKDGPEKRPRSGRFRLTSDHHSKGGWSWTNNPFKGTRQLHGLVVANLILNNWDLKSSQNKVYTFDDRPGRWFVVQDLGAALGKTGWPVGTKLNADDFESQQLVLGVENGRVLFDYHARHKELLENITPEDVVWVCTLLKRITDAQWGDLFAHSAIPGDASARFIAKIQSKIREGLALRPQTSNRL